MDCAIIGTFVGFASGIALGVFGAIIKRRFSDVDSFCSLIFHKIEAASKGRMKPDDFRIELRSIHKLVDAVLSEAPGPGEQKKGEQGVCPNGP